MFTKKLSLSIAALVLSGQLCTVSAKAEVKRPDAYESLTAVPLAPGKAPRFVDGIADLSTLENRHHEKLPMQLDGAVKKVKKSKYSPSGLSRDNPSGF